MEKDYSPYMAPKSALENVEESLDIVTVSKWLRFFNLIIDYIAVTILGMLIGIVVALLFGEQGV